VELTLVRVKGINGLFRVARGGIALELRTFWKSGAATMVE
jgi:hypothetical protein